MMPRNHCLFSMCFAGLNDRHLLCLSFEPYIGRHQACHNDQWYQNHANGVHQAAIKGIKKTSEVDFFETKIEKQKEKNYGNHPNPRIPQDLLDQKRDVFHWATWIGEAMMWLVRLLIDPGGDLVLSQMHEALDHVLDSCRHVVCKGRFPKPLNVKKKHGLGDKSLGTISKILFIA